MIYIKGRRIAKIKRYDDRYAECKNCRAINIRFTVFREYFHIFFVPIFPSDIKDVKGECLTCGAPNGNAVKEDYLNQTRTPFYLYTGTILFFTAIFLFTIFYITRSNKDSLIIDDPQVGDVYLIKEADGKSETYYWVKVTELKNGKIYLIRSSFDYDKFYLKMDHADYFDLNKRTRIKKEDLRKMYDAGEIKVVERDYESNSRFNVEYNNQ